MECLPYEIMGLVCLYLPMNKVMMIRVANKVCRHASKNYTTPTTMRIRSLARWKQSFPRLTTANISSCRNFTDSDFEHLGDVTTLDMRFCDQPTITKHAFTFLPKLRSLNLLYCCYGRGNRHPFTDDLFDSLIGLEELILDNNDLITDAGLQKLVHLKRLTLQGCSNITNRGFACPQLDMLQLYGMKNLNDALFIQIPNLTDLRMTFGNISHVGVRSLKKLRSINIVSCGHFQFCYGLHELPDLREVTLSYCPIADTEMKYLPQVKKLTLYGHQYIKGHHLHQLTHVEHLCIFRTLLEDAPLRSLVTLKHLKELHIYECRISEEIKHHLSKELPDIFHTD